LKQISSNLRRLILLFLAIGGGLAIILVLLIGFDPIPRIHAALWHLRHGNAVSYDGHTFHLPPSWYPDPHSNPGQLALQHAEFASLDLDRITLATKPPALDDRGTLDEIDKLTANLNKSTPGPSPQWTTESLRGRTLIFHCAASTGDTQQTLICQATSSDLRILVMTDDGSARTQALSILETSQ
jgi:hypothetical protein